MITWADLTEAEQVILKMAVDDGVVYDLKGTSSLIQIGLLKMNNNHDVIPTDAGRAVLAQATAQPEAEEGVDYQTMWFSVAKQLAELRVDYDELFKEFEEMPPQFTFDEQKKEIGHLRAQLAAANEREAAVVLDVSTMLTRNDVETLIRSNKRFDAIRFVHIKNGLSIEESRNYVNKVASELALQQTIDIGKKTLGTLEAELAASRAREAALREALAFYADEDNYHLQTWDDDVVASEVQMDKGYIADMALQYKVKKLADKAGEALQAAIAEGGLGDGRE